MSSTKSANPPRMKNIHKSGRKSGRNFGHKIVIIHDYLPEIGGAERNLNNFLAAFPQAHLIIPLAVMSPDVKQYINQIKRQFPKVTLSYTWLQRLPFRNQLLRFYKFFIPLALETLNLKKYHTVIYQTSFWTKGGITSPQQKSMLYINTPSRWLWHLPSARQKILNYIPKLVVASMKNWLRSWDWLATKRADVIVSNSSAVAKRVKRYYQLPSQVLWPAIDVKSYGEIGKTITTQKVPSWFAQLALPSQEYIIMLGRLEKYKNVNQAIKVFSTHQEFQKVKLVIVGNGPEYKHLIKLAEKYTQKKIGPLLTKHDSMLVQQVANIVFIRQASDEVCNILRRFSLALLNTNEEDFGLNMAETLALGRPVIALNRGGATDIVTSGETGVFFSQAKAEDIYQAVVSLKKLLVKQDITEEKCRKSALRFDQSEFVSKLRKLVESS